ncbi:MAG: YkgJ family cysteine cluster protein, partial [Verrucomicrobiaceae bacterium]|nr:YkgJ family cysteine cluster protein [Verrucomicrobiaceae bacterium]
MISASSSERTQWTWLIDPPRKARRLPVPSEPSESTSICIGCGLCCDGTLHGTTTVRPDDEAIVRARGLVVKKEGNRRFFAQPCALFSCGSCSVYAQRPNVCRKYRCALLVRVEAGEIDPSAAREKIAIAKQLRSAACARLPDAVTPKLRAAHLELLKQRLKNLGAEERTEAARALIDFAALEYCLDSFFVVKKKVQG